jgi:hypothetical protein
MTIESIKARLEAATEELDTGVLETLASLCPDVDAAMAVVTLHKHAPTDLRALLKVAEAAKQYIYGSDGDERVDYSALCAALAELEGME